MNISAQNPHRPGLNLTRFQSLWKNQRHYSFFGKYLEHLPYFFFRMQLGIDLREAINNIHRQPCPWSEKLTWKTSHRLLMFRKTFSSVSASFVPLRVRVHSELPYNFSTASISRSIARHSGASNKHGQNKGSSRLTGEIFQHGNPVHVNRRFPDTYL